MIKYISLFLCLAIISGCSQTKPHYNLDLEILNKRTGLPKGWGMGNVVNATLPNDASIEAYKIDSLTKEHGRYALLIDWTKGYKDWTASNYVIRQVFKGNTIKITGYVKTENVTKGAGLWMRLDGEDYKNLGFDNMQDRAITGTTDWKEYSIELDYNENLVKSIVVGGLIEGTGKMWMDNLRITIDGTAISPSGAGL